jgi:hypothetical protein
MVNQNRPNPENIYDIILNISDKQNNWKTIII